MLEAADDIAYSAGDIEDGFKKRSVDFNTIIDVVKNLIGDSIEEKRLLTILTDLSGVHSRYPDKHENAVQRFRIGIQSFMILSVVEAFMKHHDAILSGDFDRDLLLESKAGNLRRALKTLANNYIFTDRQILERELAGGQVVTGLLDLFVNAVSADKEKRTRSGFAEGKLYNLISTNYRFICDNYASQYDDDEPSLYDRLLLVTDFVCGMTDNYALDLYLKLTGAKL